MTAPTTDKPQTLQQLQAAAQQPRNLPAVMPGFGTLDSFELLQRQAKLLIACELVPPQYRLLIEKKNYKGEITASTENPRALANAVVALNMAQRMGADPLQVMQNLVVIEGRPSWSSQFVIASINSCGRFDAVRFDMVTLGKKNVAREYFEWTNSERQKKTESIELVDKQCIAWVLPRGETLPPGVRTLEQAKSANLAVIEGPPVSMEMAFLEGWYSKNGSKWRTMPDLMLQYRAGAFFGRLHTPEILMGMPTSDEVQDVINLERQPDGTYAADLGDLRRGSAATPQAVPEVPPKADPASTMKTDSTAPQAPAEEAKPTTGDGADLFPASDAGSKPGRKTRAPINAE